MLHISVGRQASMQTSGSVMSDHIRPCLASQIRTARELRRNAEPGRSACQACWAHESDAGWTGPAELQAARARAQSCGAAALVSTPPGLAGWPGGPPRSSPLSRRACA